MRQPDTDCTHSRSNRACTPFFASDRQTASISIASQGAALNFSTRVRYSIKPNYRPKRPKINSLPQLIYLYEPNIRHVYSPYHYCNVCKVWWLMRNVTAGCYAAKVKQIRALTEQLSPKTSFIDYKPSAAVVARARASCIRPAVLPCHPWAVCQVPAAVLSARPTSGSRHFCLLHGLSPLLHGWLQPSPAPASRATPSPSAASSHVPSPPSPAASVSPCSRWMN